MSYKTNCLHYGSKVEYSINVETISNAIDNMSINKAAGFDNLTIEHVMFAHPSIIVILSMLFNIMLHTGFVLDDFGEVLRHLFLNLKETKHLQRRMILEV